MRPILVALLLAACAAPPTAADFNAAREGLMRGEVETAAPRIRAMAEAGLPEAETLLGEMHLRGEGVARDDAAAAAWFERAARQGYADAQYELGSLYQVGRGVPKNKKTAYMWFHLAAETGGVRLWWELRDYIGAEMPPADIQAAEAEARDIVAHYPRN